MINLDALGSELKSSKDIEEFLEKINKMKGLLGAKDPKTLRDKIGSIVVGYIWANNNKYTQKAAPSMGGSGGPCMETFSVRRALGQGYGEELYNALLGLTYPNYITSDKTSVSVGAGRRWNKIASQTSDTTPPESGNYIGKFDKTSSPLAKNGLEPSWPLGKTPPREDDCVRHDVDGYESLDQGYRDQAQVAYYKQLQSNLNNFFTKEIEVLFSEPGWWGKLIGNTPSGRANKIKKSLMSLGKLRFTDFQLNPSGYVKKHQDL